MPPSLKKPGLSTSTIYSNLKKVKVERTEAPRRSTRACAKQARGFYNERAMELIAWKGTGTRLDPYDATG